MQDTLTIEAQAMVDYQKFQEKPEFQALRRRQRAFVFPLAVLFLGWYIAFVLLGAYATEFMATPVFGLINVGVLLGLAQFATTFIITMWYVRFANRRLDPTTVEMRSELAAIERGEVTQ